MILDRRPNLLRLALRVRQFARYSLGRFLGTIPDTSGAYRWFIDSEERGHFMRVELNALTKVVLDKKLATMGELSKYFEEEHELYLADLAKKWPEIDVADDGRSFTVRDAAAFAKRCRDEAWPP